MKRKIEFTESEIKDLMKDIKPLKYDGHKKEQFKQVIYNGEIRPYIISSYGRMFSIYPNGCKENNLKCLKNSISDKGYLSTSNMLIHKALASVFIKNKNPDVDILINHKDGIKTNNFYWNLEWCTAKYNIQHAEKNHLRWHPKGEEHGRNIHSEKTIRKACKLIQSNKYTFNEISEKTGISHNLLYRIYKGKVWIDISSEYDFSKFDKYIPVDKKERAKNAKKIHKVCKLLESNEYTMPEISKITGVKYKIVNGVYKGTKYVNISSQYDFSNFTKFKFKHV